VAVDGVGLVADYAVIAEGQPDQFIEAWELREIRLGCVTFLGYPFRIALAVPDDAKPLGLGLSGKFPSSHPVVIILLAIAWERQRPQARVAEAIDTGDEQARASLDDPALHLRPDQVVLFLDGVLRLVPIELCSFAVFTKGDQPEKIPWLAYRNASRRGRCERIIVSLTEQLGYVR
jgi:hypothetical protein